MKKKAVLFLYLVFAWGILPAQPQGWGDSWQENTRPDIFLKLGISQDHQLENLVGIHIRKNEAHRGISGFRVEIFFSSALDARQRALNTKASFMKDFPNIPVYVIYLSPDFKVRVGDFRSKNEALALMKMIQARFPKAFIVPDTIEYPSLN